MTSSATRLATPEGPGSVSGAPNLPSGFTDTFTSRYVDAGGLRQHVVIGGDGPPLLLVHGWPQNGHAWRLVMPSLARDFKVPGPPGAVPQPPFFVPSSSTIGSGRSPSTGSAS